MDSYPAENVDSAHEHLRALVMQLRASIDAGLGSQQLSYAEQDEIISGLPRLSESDIIALDDKEAFCPICYTPLLAILAEEEMASAMDSPAHPTEDLGVTRLSQEWQCKHVFCRRDITKWLRDSHNSCPICRKPLLKEQAERRSSSSAPPEDVVAPELDAAFATAANHAASLGSEAPDANLIHDLEHLFESFLHDGSSELEDYSSIEVPNMGDDFMGGAFFPLTSRSGREENNDRSEYSGMYS